MRKYQDLNDYELLYMVSENNQDAKDLIFEKYKPLILNFACKYYRVGKKLGLELDDFIQEGYFGLFQAFSNFTDDKECLFYTYAFRSINSKMHNLCVRNSTNKNKALNDSISLFSRLDLENESILLDIIEDKNSPSPELESDCYDFYDILKDYIYCDSILKGSILELKLNGFTINNMALILGRSRNYIAKLFNQIKRDLKCSLHKIGKCN